ncbi:unnamed protein product [Moneuplotes crassus]|uniref:Uncharacterized protein n=1 Tax=Euplotes crassus TaxID=5936 RepID=A0AAD1XHD1_EUPCR|nr:unnamed protein product [Moneuplotes crassus]
MKARNPLDLLKTQLNVEAWKQLLYWASSKLNFKLTSTLILVSPDQGPGLEETQDDLLLALKLQRIQLIKIIRTFTRTLQRFRQMLQSPYCPLQTLINYQYYSEIIDKIYQRAVREDEVIFQKLAHLCMRSIQNLISVASQGLDLSLKTLKPTKRMRKGSDITQEESRALTCTNTKDVTDSGFSPCSKRSSLCTNENETAFKRFISSESRSLDTPTSAKV